MRPTFVALCVVALALTAIGWTETERERGQSTVGQAGRTGRDRDPIPDQPSLAASPSRSVSARPVSLQAKRWQPNRSWMRDALCIYKHENGGYGWHANTGNGYYGGMQFLASTWRRAGGSGYPHRWAAREQLYRAWRIWRMYPGGSWAEWGTASRCGLR